MKKLLSIVLLTAGLFAQANQIFTINPSVYSAGMGNTGISHANIKNLYHNPALIALDTNYAGFTSVSWLPNLNDDMQYHNLTYTHTKGFGVELFYFDYGDQVHADANGIIIGSFQSSSYKLSGSYGKNIKGWLLGGRFNIYNHDFIDTVDIGSSFGIDIGALKSFRLSERDYASIGIVVKDLGTKSDFIDESLDLPTSLGLAAKYTLGNLFTIAADAKLYNEYYSVGLGTEYYYKDLFEIRLGYYMEPEYEVEYFTFGAGIKAKGLGLDVGFLMNPDSFHNKTVMLSLGFEI
tara:strand:- start:1367 stop:2242 length:876 start_codon:yes stop_codon:yes gene_type:complete